MSINHVEIDGKKIRVYQICECDAVAAESEVDAIEFYKKLTGLEDNELYAPEDIEIVDLQNVVYVREDSSETTTVDKIVKEYWTGEPFIALTTGGY